MPAVAPPDAAERHKAKLGALVASGLALCNELQRATAAFAAECAAASPDDNDAGAGDPDRQQVAEVYISLILYK